MPGENRNMKCQRCAQKATLHITEVHPAEPYEEFHLCADCAKKYLYAPMASAKSTGFGTENLEEDPVQKSCPHCGIKFIEFRNSGRLGCPYDYMAFQEELSELLLRVHGDLAHVGKIPRRLAVHDAQHLELQELRTQLQQAITDEDYESAAQLRDRIQAMEEPDVANS